MKRVVLTRWESPGPGRRALDAVAVEEPFELQCGYASRRSDHAHPGHDEELAAGFLVSEGLVRSRADVLELRRDPRNRDRNVLDVFLSPDVVLDFAKLTAMCLRPRAAACAGSPASPRSGRRFRGWCRGFDSWKTLLRLPDAMRSAQKTFEETGGLHAAALFDGTGTLECVREDVGRHNAVDKVVGRAFWMGAGR